VSLDLSTLRNFFAFGRWANRMIVESVAVLTAEEYARPIGGSFGSVLTPERLAEPLSYVAFSGDSFTRRLGDALLHLANHGTYHRGQVATLLRQLGRKAAATDYLRFIDDALTRPADKCMISAWQSRRSRLISKLMKPWRAASGRESRFPGSSRNTSAGAAPAVICTRSCRRSIFRPALSGSWMN
jgi:hypothetical protein